MIIIHAGQSFFAATSVLLIYTLRHGLVLKLFFNPFCRLPTLLHYFFFRFSFAILVADVLHQVVVVKLCKKMRRILVLAKKVRGS